MMYGLIPMPKHYENKNSKSKAFNSINFVTATDLDFDPKKLGKMRFWNYEEVSFSLNNKTEQSIDIILNVQSEVPQQVDLKDLYIKQGYSLDVQDDQIELSFMEKDGFINGLSTLKQLIEEENSSLFVLKTASIVDWPSIEKRSVSNTFAWYAGYGRIGFDMQLWGLKEWVEYLNICADFKINQFNMCMYGYWPFDFDKYPETELRNYPVDVWNQESDNWISVNYVHPNISNEFLTELFEYGHELGFDFFAYIGLNSYNGGYSSLNKHKRMKLEEGSKFVNDFDSLCLSDPTNIQYISDSIQKVVELGYDGIDFEESEESYWFCSCDDCQENFVKDRTPAEAKHHANYYLLNVLYKKIKEVNKDCVVGLRAWREPPLEKTEEYLQYVKEQIPEDVVLFWAPGLYVSENEFPKWVEAFGPERIYARDSESNSVSSTMGRLYRVFESNVLRPEEETNHQFINNDIKQHIGSVELGVKGINGYMFEWYGYFIHLYAHGYYGWGSNMPEEEFYEHAVNAVFGPEITEDIMYVLENMLTIHESQMKIFPTEFPFLRNKVEKRDIPTIEAAIADWDHIQNKIEKAKAYVKNDKRLAIYYKHFEKIEVGHLRNKVIYNLSLASINYDNAETEEEKRKYLLLMDKYNEENFDIVKREYFDVNPVAETGTKACMIPYHELKRVIHNELDPANKDEEQIYLGVEALGWLWL